MEDNEQSYYPFNKNITISIEENKEVAATDASVKGASMGVAWIITDTEKKFEVCDELHNKKWEDNTSGVAEVIVLLELITVLKRRRKHITNEKIRIGFDN